MDNAPSTRPSSLENSTSTTRSRSLPRKQASYDASALTINPSPLLTSSLHSRNSATSAQESAYLKRARWLGWVRLGLALLTLGSATAAAGCAGHVLRRYNATHLASGWHLSLWPLNVDLRPTLAVVASAAIITAASLGYLVLWLIPSPHSRTLLYNFVFLGSSLVGVVLCVFTIPFNLILVNPSSHHQRESLQSWTCKFSDGASRFNSDAQSLQIPVFATHGVPVPAGFERLCMEAQVGTGLMIAVLVLEAASCALAGVGILLEKQMTKARRERYANCEKGEHGS
ncbi:hypothetical protein A1O3_03113 [Capronia epimyces CBS 606.96]|uniref:Uncharacterized protein n=1 Tax=Capronia epimyces CBS 606.96 TaxID=1182542 RepID=W9YK38_9EURO|nr:uncharacterized protein A1O3_03113 [Capronia epimyces CBS 606.96]EXJ90045.1 hypothetical protein A1O3_03113 [Capronia epimyces CBS 606.96]